MIDVVSYAELMRTLFIARHALGVTTLIACFPLLIKTKYQTFGFVLFVLGGTGAVHIPRYTHLL